MKTNPLEFFELEDFIGKKLDRQKLIDNQLLNFRENLDYYYARRNYGFQLNFMPISETSKGGLCVDCNLNDEITGICRFMQIENEEGIQDIDLDQYTIALMEKHFVEELLKYLKRAPSN